jgi:ubiquinone/menaquinone biosynthesis C-methylase UbiE
MMGTAEANGRLWGHRAEEWAELQEQTALPLYNHVFDALKVSSQTRYLDVGCGSGLALSEAARRGAQVSGLDAAAALTTIAKRRAPKGDVREGELEQLPFADGAFDLVTGFNAFQYAASPVQALREAARVTRKGGQVVIATWSPPELTQASKLIAALKPLMPPPPPGAPGPFALSDEAALKRLARDAGLQPVATHDVESPFNYQNLQTAVRAMNSSGVAARAIGNTSAEQVTKAHEAAFAEFVKPDGTVSVPNRFRYLVATVG